MYDMYPEWGPAKNREHDTHGDHRDSSSDWQAPSDQRPDDN